MRGECAVCTAGARNREALAQASPSGRRASRPGAPVGAAWPFANSPVTIAPPRPSSASLLRSRALVPETPRVPAVAPAVRRVIVGTAGHIDHGKTTLVERLTGIRTDRLPEEQERGMTLDVGYAEFKLKDGTEVGLLDVPGHERLVRTMVAGATSMDLALLVVAADDGPMLQTREHVDILDLLGVRRAIVVMTKTDLVEPAHADLVEEEVRAMLAGTTLEGAPVLRVSSVTGEGVDALKQAISDAIPPLDDRAEDARVFRMPILRAFLAPGRGTVVTGIPLAGRIADGDAVEVFPARLTSRVRGIQVHHRDAKEARAGHRTALALADVAVEALQRGMVVAAAGTFGPCPRFSARLRVLRRVGHPLKHGMPVRVHVGADQVPARLHCLLGESVAPGAVAAVELEGREPFLVAPGDHFVLRADNATETLGGGVVVERLEQRLPRRREGIAAAVLARAERLHEPAALVAATLAAAGERGADLPALALANALRVEALGPVADALVAGGTVVRAGRGRLFARDGFAALRKRVVDAVVGLHKKEPGVPFLPLSAVRTAVGRCEGAALEAVLDELVKVGDLRRSPEGAVAWKSHAAEMPAADRERADRVLAELLKGKGMPPEEGELCGILGWPAPVMRKVLTVLETRKEVLRAQVYWFHAGWVEEAKRALTALGKAKGGFTASEARETLATTRKFIIPLLEALDDRGFTRRAGDKRTVLAATP